MSVCENYFPSDVFVLLFFPTLSPDQAIYKTSDQCHSEGWIEPSYPDASFSIQRFYSWTSSFVRIEPLWKDLSCGQKKMITVYYILNTEGYEGINAVNFYYVVSVGLLHSLLKGLDRADGSDSPSTAITALSILPAFGLPASTTANNPRTETAIRWFELPLFLGTLLFFIVRDYLHNISGQGSCPFPPEKLFMVLPASPFPSFPSASWSGTRGQEAAAASSVPWGWCLSSSKPSGCICLDCPVNVHWTWLLLSLSNLYKPINMLFFSAQGMAKGKIVLTGEIKVNIQAGKLSYQIHVSA